MNQQNAYWDGDITKDSGLAKDQYHDPTQDVTMSGHTVASVLPPRTGIGAGVIVPRATMGGAPPGYVPGQSATRMNIDPDIPGEGFVVDPTAMTKEASANATQAADVLNATSIEDQRQRASAAMRAFQISDKPDKPAPRTAVAPPQPAIALPATYTAPIADGDKVIMAPDKYPQQVSQQQQFVTAGSGVIPGFEKPANSPASFGAPVAVLPPQPRQPAASAPSMFSRATSPAVVAPAGTPQRPAGDAPTYKVTFEVANSPATIEAWYHQIIVNEHILALCYDLSTVGYPRATLRATEDDVAVHIEGSAVFYIAQDPAIRFTHSGEEIQLFFIKAEHPFDVSPPVVEQPMTQPGPILP